MTTAKPTPAMPETKSEWANAKTVKTPKFRVSFPNVFSPKAFDPKDKAKFSLTMLFPKNTDLTELKKAAHFATIEKWGADKTKWPKNLRSPFRDGDEKADLSGYAGNIFVSASSEQRPGLIDQQRNPIEVEAEFYAGCFARAQIRAFAYEVRGNAGISFALQNIQKLADGEAFSGKKPAETVFNDDFKFDDSGLDIESNDLGF